MMDERNRNRNRENRGCLEYAKCIGRAENKYGGKIKLLPVAQQISKESRALTDCSARVSLSKEPTRCAQI